VKTRTPAACCRSPFFQRQELAAGLFRRGGSGSPSKDASGPRREVTPREWNNAGLCFDRHVLRDGADGRRLQDSRHRHHRLPPRGQGFRGKEPLLIEGRILPRQRLRLQAPPGPAPLMASGRGLNVLVRHTGSGLHERTSSPFCGETVFQQDRFPARPLGLRRRDGSCRTAAAPAGQRHKGPPLPDPAPATANPSGGSLGAIARWPMPDWNQWRAVSQGASRPLRSIQRRPAPHPMFPAQFRQTVRFSDFRKGRVVTHFHGQQGPCSAWPDGSGWAEPQGEKRCVTIRTAFTGPESLLPA